jgi:heme exporter protein C
MSPSASPDATTGAIYGTRTGILPFALLGSAVPLLLVGSYLGLFVAPPERFMGDVQRIMYIHVPTAWSAMLIFCLAFVAALAYLFKGGVTWDARTEAAIEVGVVLSFLLCAQGAIWAKPTWGVWWDWDPRLTTTAVMLFTFLGILLLRRLVEDPGQRATWSAVATVIAFVNVPIVYFSVNWWSSLHQIQSTPTTVSSAFHWPLRINAVAMLLLALGLVGLRARVSALRLAQELTPPPRREAPIAEAVALRAP